MRSLVADHGHNDDVAGARRCPRALPFPSGSVDHSAIQSACESRGEPLPTSPEDADASSPAAESCRRARSGIGGIERGAAGAVEAGRRRNNQRETPRPHRIHCSNRSRRRPAPTTSTEYNSCPRLCPR